MKQYDNYLNGTSGSESELPEDNVSSDVIALVLGLSMSDSRDVSLAGAFSRDVSPNVEGAEDGPASVFCSFVLVLAVSVVFHFFFVWVRAALVIYTGDSLVELSSCNAETGSNLCSGCCFIE